MKKTLLLTIFLVSSFIVSAQQDLYNYENSRRFGEYLLKSGQFELATKEYERLVFLNPTNDTLKLNLLKAYRLNERFETGILRTQQLYPATESLPFPHTVEYSKLLMNDRQWTTANAFWDKSENMPADDKQLFKTSASIFNTDFEAAKSYLRLINDSTNVLAVNYNRIVDEGLYGKRKSPFLAGALSTVTPGLGRVYSGDWKDGLVSLIFTAGMAFQSYRGFDQGGIKSAKGWIYGGVGAGFYLGNIYGSVKSAKNKNKKKTNLLQHEASTLFNAYYN
jgi:tetratricopeptide (TPR) repeat protein